MWMDPGEIVLDRERHTVQSLKFMRMVVWNPIGFHVLKALSKGRKFNAQYYIIIQMISWSQSQIGAGRPGEHGRTLWVHSDNARSHGAKMSRDYISLNQMKQAPNPSIRQIWHPRTFSFLATLKES
jgi:hypothetical protein